MLEELDINFQVFQTRAANLSTLLGSERRNVTGNPDIDFMYKVKNKESDIQKKICFEVFEHVIKFLLPFLYLLNRICC